MTWQVVSAALVISAFGGPAAGPVAGPDGDVLTFQDKRIGESSGLVDLGTSMVTTNDSGDTARVFVVDGSSGETVGLTSFSATTLDVESLAPAGPEEVWVGDIGDNTRSREDVTVYRVPVGRRQIEVGSPEEFRLVYPDGPHDAESLFVDSAGRLNLVTKSLTGAGVYRAPATLRATGTNRLTAVAKLGDFATDAAVLGNGRFVVVRGPGQASVYTFPAFDRVGTFALPRQPQGEGISVGPGGRIRISSEGVGSTVKEVQLPAAIAAAMQQPSPPTTTPLPSAEDGSRDDGSSATTWLGWSVAGALLLAAVGVGRAGAMRSRMKGSR